MSDIRTRPSVAEEYLRQIREAAAAKDRTDRDAGESRPLPTSLESSDSRPTTRQATGTSSTSRPGTGDESESAWHAVKPDHVALLWRRFAAMFGDNWTRSYGPTDEHGVWLAGLRRAGLTPERLGVGLRAVLGSGKTFPPSLPEFVKLCKPLDGLAGHQAAGAEAAKSKALPISDEERARRRQVAADAIAECRRILAGGRDERGG